jgi:hypothetical protein
VVPAEASIMGMTEAKTQPAPSRRPLIFPILFAGVLYLTGFGSLYGLFADPGILRDQLNSLSGAIPGGAIPMVAIAGKIASRP